MATIDDAETVRSMIKAENEFANHRIGWMSATNGLLFAGVAFAWGKGDVAPIISLLCVVGILICLTTFHGVFAAVDAIYLLSDWWEDNKPAGYSGPEVMGGRPGLKGFLRYFGAPPMYPPLIFLVVWIALLVVVQKGPNTEIGCKIFLCALFAH